MTPPKLFEAFPPFSHMPLLIGGKAMEHYSLREGDDWDFVVFETDFQCLRERFPNSFFTNTSGDDGLRIEAYEFYKSQFGFPIEQLERGAVERSDFRVAHVEILFFLKILTLVGDSANKKARRDIFLLMRWLDVELTPDA